MIVACEKTKAAEEKVKAAVSKVANDKKKAAVNKNCEKCAVVASSPYPGYITVKEIKF